MSVRLVFESRSKCQDFVARYKDDGIPYAINSPFCRTSTTITVRQSRSIEDREIGKQFAPLWKVLADQLKLLFSPDSVRSCSMLGQSNFFTATGSLGSHGPGRLMTIEIQRVDLILSLVLKMNMHEVPSYYGSRVNSTTLELQFGSLIFGENPTCQQTVNLLRFIVRQVPCRPDLYLKQEPNVTTLWPDVKMMVSPMKWTVFCCAKTTITVRQSKSLEDWEIGKQFAKLWRVLAEQLKILFPGWDDEGAFIVPLLDARSQVLSITDHRNGVGKPCVQTCPYWKWTVVYPCCT